MKLSKVLHNKQRCAQLIHSQSKFFKDFRFILQYDENIKNYDLEFNTQLNKLSYSCNRFCNYNYEKLYDNVFKALYNKAKFICEYERVKKLFIRINKKHSNFICDYYFKQLSLNDMCIKYDISTRTIFRKLESIEKRYCKIIKEKESEKEIC